MFKHVKSSLTTLGIIPLLLLLPALWGCNNTSTSTEEITSVHQATGIPRLVDLGADKCIPCQKMAPLLEQLKQDFHAEMGVEIIDVWKNKEQAAAYNVKMIPTQIFYAPDGTELYRHVGFYSRKEIIQKWAELGYPFEDNN
ncbi:MAG: thioredoxin family protein [Desulfuromonadaceae bacterium]|nr:thioredoxin family protein [Desulfuromonadaceae bacterium]